MSLRLMLLFILILITISGCSQKSPSKETGRLKITTTIFPVYDFARAIAGDAADVTLILPPGTEAHSFEPKPEDMVRSAKSDLFIYSSLEMEPWAGKILPAITGEGRAKAVEAGQSAVRISNGSSGNDPHIWLDFDNAGTMVNNIAAALKIAKPEKAAVFTANAAALIEKMKNLDSSFRTTLTSCETREFVHGGHYAFAYLAKRYNLSYISAYGVAADSEPTPKKIIELVKTMREKRLKSLFYEELLSPAVARTVAAETGAAMIKLNSLHEITQDDFNGGATYLSLMQGNLDGLKKGLVCRAK